MFEFISDAWEWLVQTAKRIVRRVRKAIAVVVEAVVDAAQTVIDHAETAVAYTATAIVAVAGPLVVLHTAAFMHGMSINSLLAPSPFLTLYTAGWPLSSILLLCFVIMMALTLGFVPLLLAMLNYARSTMR